MLSERKKKTSFKRLAFIDTVPYWFDGQEYSTDVAVTKFVLACESYFDRIILFGPVIKSANKQGKYPINTKKVGIAHFPPYVSDLDSYIRLPFYLPQIILTFMRYLSEFDIAWVVTPHFPALLFWLLAKIYKKPMFFWIRSNLREEFECLYPNGVKHFLSNLFGNFLDSVIKVMMRNTLTFVMGSALVRLYQPYCRTIYSMNPTLIRDSDILTEAKPPIGDIVNLLSVGRITPEKGLKYLIEALSKIVHRINKKVHLTIIGDGRAKCCIMDLVSRKNLSSYVTFTGHIPFGSELIKYYKNSDIFILPSLTEGVPLTLYEALAHQVAVVATSVGGIPDVIKNRENGILIPAANEKAIAEAVIELIQHPTLYQRIVRNGLETVRAYTVEKKTEELMNIIQYHFNSVHGGKLRNDDRLSHKWRDTRSKLQTSYFSVGDRRQRISGDCGSVEAGPDFPRKQTATL